MLVQLFFLGDTVKVRRVIDARNIGADRLCRVVVPIGVS